MPEYCRVFPHVATAAAREPGGAFYIPPQGSGRLDNPESYAVLYLSDAAAGAMAESFGRFLEWDARMLARNEALGSVPALARFEFADSSRLCDLDNADALRRWDLRPSEVVTRDYRRTRAWAQRIHQQGDFGGVRWWSYYDPQWGSVGIWETTRLRLLAVEPIELTHPALVEAARVIRRRIVRRRRRT